MKIGTFTQHSNGNISGSISTFGGNFENVNLVPTDRTAPSPQYTLETKGCDLGAAWEKISKDEKPYMSVQLKGPFLPQPIWAILIEDEASRAVTRSFGTSSVKTNHKARAQIKDRRKTTTASLTSEIPEVGSSSLSSPG